MADERCVFPGDGPRTSGRWLNRETAERLLRGEPLDNAVAADSRDQAERLARALATLSPPPSTADTELPGETAALAAFREARKGWAAAAVPGEVRDEDVAAVAFREARKGQALTAAPEDVRDEDVASAAFREARDAWALSAAVGEDGDGDSVAAPVAARARAGRAGDIGAVRIGGRVGRGERRSRWGRPVRLGLAAALAAGMAGGVAAAVGVGVLPKPFGSAEPAPAASVSAPVTPEERPLLSPSPEAAPGRETGSATPEGTPGGSGGGSPSATPGGTPGADSDNRKPRDTGWSGAASACRDLRDGRDPGADRKRTLDGVAGGSSRVRTYCKNVLDGATGGRDTRDKGEARDGKDDGKGGKDGKGGGKDQGGNDDLGDRGGRGDHDGRHHSRGDNGSRHFGGDKRNPHPNAGGGHHGLPGSLIRPGP